MDLEPLKIACIDSPEGLASLEAEWRELFVRSGANTPFATFEWAQNWWKYMSEERWMIRDHLRIYTFRSASGQLAALVPMILTKRPASGSVRLGVIQFMGADNNITEARGLLAAPEYECEVSRLLYTYLCRKRFHWVRWSGLQADRDGWVLNRLSRKLPEIHHHHLPLPADWEEFRSGLKRNIKESLRKCYNSLQRDHHTWRLNVICEPEQMEEGLKRFYKLHQMRAKQQSSITHANVFEKPQSRDFLQAVCVSLAKVGITRIFELEVNGEVAASRIGFQFSDLLYLYYSGYDPAWGDYSVMTTTVAEAIRYAIDQRLRTVHLSTGTDVSKTRWGTVQTSYHEGIQFSHQPYAPFIYNAYNAVAKAQNSNSKLGRMLYALSRYQKC